MNNLKHLFDYKEILKNTPDKDKLSVILKKGKKGVSLFAIKDIKKGDIIAYYKIKVYKIKEYTNTVKDDMYLFTIYNKNGYAYKKFIGDIYEGSLPKPKRNIPYWAYFANEPSIGEKQNSYMDKQSFENFTKKNRTRLHEDDIVTYALVADSDIKKEEEILWCYGDSYNRNYKVNCK